MIDLETKNRLLKELEKTGNVSIAYARAGIDRSTHYEWLKNDKEFGKKMREALKRGREANVDIGEHSLMLKVKDKDLGAIKYLLSHNSQRYKPKIRKVIIEHSTTGEKMEKFKEMEREHWDKITEAYIDLTEFVRDDRSVGQEFTEKMKNMFPEIKDEISRADDRPISE